jgi:hypothetical protein
VCKYGFQPAPPYLELTLFFFSKSAAAAYDELAAADTF